MSQQDQVEFTLWLRENQKAFLRAAKMICFDTQNAEDVLQEALADVFKRWKKIREHENPEAYLMRVMVSKHADMRRKWLRRQQEKETSWDLAENIRDLVDQTEDVTQRLLVQAALKSLSAAQRAVLVLIYEHGMVLREVLAHNDAVKGRHPGLRAIKDLAREAAVGQQLHEGHKVGVAVDALLLQVSGANLGRLTRQIPEVFRPAARLHGLD